MENWFLQTFLQLKEKSFNFCLLLQEKLFLLQISQNKKEV